MHALLKLGNPVLLYHGTFREIPKDLAARVHNVHPEKIADQLAYLRKTVRFVTVDEFAASRRTRGLAAVTFDDGYKCVRDFMADILIGLDIPFTIFVNGSTLERKVTWRDKVRAIMGSGLVSECEQSLVRTQKLRGQSFYRYTKDPRNDSRAVDEELDGFLEKSGLRTEPANRAIDDRIYFMDHPLVSYGNHSHHHYVLSSLDREHQHEEILRTQRLLESIPNIRVSRVFAIPFGEPRDFNQDTVELLADLQYSAALLSRQRLNYRRRKRAGVELIERFMPRDASLAEQLPRLACSI